METEGVGAAGIGRHGQVDGGSRGDALQGAAS
jgi:hypothetical protein